MSNQKTIEKKKRLGILVIFTLSIMLVMPFLQVPTVKAVAYSYTFYGPYNEVTGAIDLYAEFGGYPIHTTITVYYPSGSPLITSFYLGSNTYYNATQYSITITPSVKPTYYTVDVANLTGPNQNFHREYYLGPNENTGTYSIYVPLATQSVNTYTISFMDQVGILKTQPYISIQKFVEGAYHTVEQRLVDVQNIVLADLQEGVSYHILFGDGTTWTTYGDLTVTSITGIQLILRGVDFPKETLLIYQYIHASAIRDFLNPVGAITTSYEDITNSTTSVTLTITDTLANLVVYNKVFTDQVFSYTWLTAINATTYHVTLNIVTTTYGNLYFSYMLPAEGLHNTSAFSLEFLGSLGVGISTAWIIPALLIIFVAGCFSELTSEAAAIITIIIAIILVWMGWLEISTGAIITALTLSVLAGIVSVKRRFG
jgi:hypothetical protein